MRCAVKHGPLGVAIPATDERAEGWTGPVERRPASSYQSQTSVGIIHCPFCTHWMGETSHLCPTCHIPLTPFLHHVS